MDNRYLKITIQGHVDPGFRQDDVLTKSSSWRTPGSMLGIAHSSDGDL